MTPDKIYIRAYQDINRASTHLDNEWVSKPKPFTNSIEYIRKDALLEWARKRKETYLDLASKSGDGVEWGQEYAFEELIDKLESL